MPLRVEAYGSTVPGVNAHNVTGGGQRYRINEMPAGESGR
jgi:hypothetical protein